MESTMSAEQVIDNIKQLHDNGESLSKKHIKKSYPDLLKNALYYYPSWDHALQKSGLSLH